MRKIDTQLIGHGSAVVINNYNFVHNPHLFTLIKVNPAFELTALFVHIVLQEVLARQLSTVSEREPSLPPSLQENL